MKTSKLEQTHRQTIANLISDIIHLPDFNTREKQTIAFACMFARLIKADNNITYITAIAAGGLNKSSTDYAVYLEALRINSIIHNMEDDTGQMVFNQDTGLLSSDWEESLLELSIAMEESIPPAFMPMDTPTNLQFPRHDTGVQLINTKRSFSWQPPKQMPLVYDALNALQAQGYRLSPVMTELTNLPLAIDFNENYAARHIMVNSMKAFSNEFYFRYTMDYRGRIYARSLILHPQGDSFAKASLVLGEKKPLGKHGLGALAIHYANCSGHDKASFNQRRQWARQQGMVKARRMFEAKGNWNLISPLIEDRKHQFEEYTAAIEYYRACNSVSRKHFLSNLIVHQDATNSGFQFGAALTGDRATAELVNITTELDNFTITANHKPADLYGKMSCWMIEDIRDKGEELCDWLPVIDRSFCKKPIMTTGYGASIKTIMEGSENKAGSQGIFQYMTKLEKTNPEHKHLTERYNELQPTVEYALEKTASAMLRITETMQKHSEDIVANGNETIEWHTPDGFHVIQQKRDNTGRVIELANSATTFERLKPGKKDPIDAEGMSRATSPNFIHTMDAQLLRTAALECWQHIAFVPIHDSFGTHACDFFVLNNILKSAFIQTMEYDWYGDFCQTNSVIPNLRVSNDYDYRECLKSVYMFS